MKQQQHASAKVFVSGSFCNISRDLGVYLLDYKVLPQWLQPPGLRPLCWVLGVCFTSFWQFTPLFQRPVYSWVSGDAWKQEASSNPRMSESSCLSFSFFTLLLMLCQLITSQEWVPPMLIKSYTFYRILHSLMFYMVLQHTYDCLCLAFWGGGGCWVLFGIFLCTHPLS